MRLTLRTLLAYLDDTLEPSEIKTIGQKVAESDAAQELVARIKQVTRRRRLTTPTDGGPGERFDPNRVAAYLDNELSGEELAELEKICLESDVHLAEIAATHQILTLVLGEPALVPPTAKRRMYALSHGRPKKTSNQQPPVTKTAVRETAGLPDIGEDNALLALPLFRNAPWLRWALPMAALVLLGILGVVLWNNLGGPADNRSTSREKTDGDTPPEDKDKTKTDAPKTDAPKTDAPKTDAPKTDAPKTDAPKTDAPKTDTKTEVKTDVKTKPPDEGPGIPPVGKPSMERQPLGRFVSKEQVLVQRDQDTWKRISLGDPVQTGEQLISLPGFKSEVRLTGKLDLLLWGSLAELSERTPVGLLESAVTLHHNPPPGISAEMTLHRGRVYITGRQEKGEVRIRLRFWREETWDLILEEPETMVGFELITLPANLISLLVRDYKPQQGDEPFVQVALYVLKGRASLKVDRRTFGDLRGPTGPSLFVWNNKGRGVTAPFTPPERIPEWDPEQPLPAQPRDHDLAKRLNVALTELALTLTRPEKRVESALQEYLAEKDPEHRLVGVRSLVAIDAVTYLLDEVAREDPGRQDVRREALGGLRTWLSRGLEQASKLYDRKTMTGLLPEKGFSNLESQIVLDLLNGFTPEEWRQKETFEVLILYLRHKKMLIRDLAWRQLEALAPGQKIEYHPAAPPEVRERGADLWKKLLDAGKLPPPPPPMPPK